MRQAETDSHMHNIYPIEEMDNRLSVCKYCERHHKHTWFIIDEANINLWEAKEDGKYLRLIKCISQE